MLSESRSTVKFMYIASTISSIPEHLADVGTLYINQDPDSMPGGVYRSNIIFNSGAYYDLYASCSVWNNVNSRITSSFCPKNTVAIT